MELVHGWDLRTYMERRDDGDRPSPTELGDHPFLLVVATLDPRKNVGTLLEEVGLLARQGLLTPIDARH